MIDEERMRNAVNDVLIHNDKDCDEEEIAKIVDALKDDEDMDRTIKSFRRQLVKEISDEQGRRDVHFDGSGTLTLELDKCVIPSCERTGELRDLDEIYNELEEEEHLEITICQHHLDELITLEE